MLGNSTLHGLHLIANGLPSIEGDEVLVIADDYPATLCPGCGRGGREPRWRCTLVRVAGSAAVLGPADLDDRSSRNPHARPGIGGHAASEKSPMVSVEITITF